MALATTIEGDGILTSVDVNIRVWRVFSVSKIYKYTESIKNEVREWVALTKTIAQTTAETASQDGLATGASASYVASEDNRTIASYKLIKTIAYGATVSLEEKDYPE